MSISAFKPIAAVPTPGAAETSEVVAEQWIAQVQASVSHLFVSNGASSSSAAPQRFDVGRLYSLLLRLLPGLDVSQLKPMAVVDKLVQGLPQRELRSDELMLMLAEQCAYMSQWHPDYSRLGARVAVRSLAKSCPKMFSEMVERMASNTDRTGSLSPLVNSELLEFVRANSSELDAIIVPERDQDYDYFGFKTLEKSYLVRVGGEIVETPQYMLLRTAVAIHMPDMGAIKEAYEMMSERYYTHASPTLFNAGTRRQQMSSCFLTQMKEDSVEGIYDTVKECALISQSAGGIGMSVSNIRCHGSYIRSTGGSAAGLVPVLRVLNSTARYVDQGGGKRKGSIAAYLEPWHADVYDFIELRKNHGKEEQRARDLFYGMWICDLFMQRVEENGKWTLMCPSKCPGLQEAVGEEFKALYERYEAEGRGVRTVQAQHLWFALLQSQIETGMPYMLYKDACNLKSNQKNLGTIKCSNLCTEIIQYTSPEETAVCNLASVALPRFVKENADGSMEMDYPSLHRVVKFMTKSLNKVIDRNYYPVMAARKSNMRHRPIGIGVQGLADALMLLRLPFESDEAALVNKHAFETIYHASVEASTEIAMEVGAYESFQGSPASQGRLQYHLWVENERIESQKQRHMPSLKMWDWETLVQNVKTHGMRNSLLVAPMPTASTAQILGNNESFEPYTQNIYVRRVLSGEFVQVNRHLLRDLVRLGLWDDEMKNALIANNGSIQNIEKEGLTQNIKDLYKTVWEMKQRVILDMAVARAPYIDQSQSLNVHMTDASSAKLSSMHFYAWKNGLKTGLYYLRTRAAVDPIKVTLDATTPVHKTNTATQEVPMEVMTPSAFTTAGMTPTSRLHLPVGKRPAEEVQHAALSAMMADQARKEEGECLSCGA